MLCQTVIWIFFNYLGDILVVYLVDIKLCNRQRYASDMNYDCYIICLLGQCLCSVLSYMGSLVIFFMGQTIELPSNYRKPD